MADEITSQVAFGASFDGSFRSKKSLGIKINGRLNGEVVFDSGGTIHVGVSGQVDNAKLEADYVYIEGKVTGSVIARKAVEISETATVVGEVTYHQTMAIHPRARLEGEVKYGGEMKAPRSA